MSRIFVTGDCHASYTKFGFKIFPEGRELTKDDYVIICGDFGFWADSDEQNFWMDWLEDRPFTTLWVDGNHENFDLLAEMPVAQWHGGKVHFIRPSVIHLMRGQVFDIAGKKFFTFGGARSHDISDGILEPEDPNIITKYKHLESIGALFRINHISWWKEEMPSDLERSEGLDSLEKAKWKVDYSENGYDLDEGIKIAKLIAPHVNLLQVSAGTHEDPVSCTYMHPSMLYPHGVNVYLAAEIKKHIDTPVATIGGIGEPEMIEEIIASGKADVVEMSRALMADPELPNKMREGREDDITKCIRCLLCHYQTDSTKRNIRCTVNPVIGRELEHLNAFPPTMPKKVLIAGGGPGGLQAAVTAAERGHSVILCEATDKLGGLLNYEQHVPFKKELFEFPAYSAGQWPALYA